MTQEHGIGIVTPYKLNQRANVSLAVFKATKKQKCHYYFIFYNVPDSGIEFRTLKNLCIKSERNCLSDFTLRDKKWIIIIHIFIWIDLNIYLYIYSGIIIHSSFHIRIFKPHYPLAETIDSIYWIYSFGGIAELSNNKYNTLLPFLPSSESLSSWSNSNTFGIFERSLAPVLIDPETEEQEQ